MNKNSLKSLKSTISKARTTSKVLDLAPQTRKYKKAKSLRLLKKKLWKLKLLKCQLTLRLRSSCSRKKERGAPTLPVGLVMRQPPLNLLKMAVKNKQKFRQSSLMTRRMTVQTSLWRTIILNIKWQNERPTTRASHHLNQTKSQLKKI